MALVGAMGKPGNLNGLAVRHLVYLMAINRPTSYRETQNLEAGSLLVDRVREVAFSETN